MKELSLSTSRRILLFQFIFSAFSVLIWIVRTSTQLYSYVFLKFIVNTVHYVSVHINTSAHKSQRCHFFLELVLPMAMNHLIWVWGIKLGFSGGTDRIMSHLFSPSVCLSNTRTFYRRFSKDIIFFHMTYSYPYFFNTSSGSNPGHIMVVFAQCQKHALNIELGYLMSIPVCWVKKRQ